MCVCCLNENEYNADLSSKLEKYLSGCNRFVWVCFIIITHNWVNLLLIFSETYFVELRKMNSVMEIFRFWTKISNCRLQLRLWWNFNVQLSLLCYSKPIIRAISITQSCGQQKRHCVLILILSHVAVILSLVWFVLVRFILFFFVRPHVVDSFRWQKAHQFKT